MLKDRRALLEQEIVKQKQACGALYLCIVKGETGWDKTYDDMKAKLADKMTELMIVDQMINDGHK
jgi:hypothetical protein